MSTRKAIKQIVVGLDGSPHSQASLEMAIEIARSMGSRITAVYAVEMPIMQPERYMNPFQSDGEWRKTMRADFEEVWCEPLRRAHVPYRALMEDGRAASVISQIAEAANADIIVVGRRGRGGIAELLLGSVSHELVMRSKIPVLVMEPEQIKKPKRARRAA